MVTLLWCEQVSAGCGGRVPGAGAGGGRGACGPGQRGGVHRGHPAGPGPHRHSQLWYRRGQPLYSGIHTGSSQFMLLFQLINRCHSRVPQSCLQSSTELFTEFPRVVYRVPQSCLQSDSELFTVLSRVVYRVPQICLQSAPELFTECPRVVYRVPQSYLQSAPELFTECPRVIYEFSTVVYKFKQSYMQVWKFPGVIYSVFRRVVYKFTRIVYNFDKSCLYLKRGSFYSEKSIYGAI